MLAVIIMIIIMVILVIKMSDYGGRIHAILVCYTENRGLIIANGSDFCTVVKILKSSLGLVKLGKQGIVRINVRVKEERRVLLD